MALCPMVTITSFSVRRRIAFKSQYKTWVFVPFLIISRSTDAAIDECLRNAQIRQLDKSNNQGLKWEYAALTDELRKHLLSQHHPSVADKVTENLETKAINTGSMKNLPLTSIRYEWNVGCTVGDVSWDGTTR